MIAHSQGQTEKNNMTQELTHKEQPGNGRLKGRISPALARVIDLVLTTSMIVALLSHISYATGLLFPYPLSYRSRVGHTLLCVVGTFLLWFPWKWSRGHVRRSR